MLKNISWWWKILFCSVAIVVGIVAVGIDPYVNFVKEKLIGVSRAQGVQVALHSVEGGINWLHAQKAEVVVYTKPFAIPLELSDFELHVPFSSLFEAPALRVQGNLYEGSLDLEASTSYDRKQQSCSGKLEKTKVSLHPQLRFLGFVGGLLSAEFDNLELLNRKPHKGNLRFDLKNLKHPDKMELPSFLTGLPITIRIPAFSIDSFTGDLALEEKTIVSKTFSLKSSMGTIEGKELKLSGPQQLRGYFDISLTEDGLSFIGPLLPLLSQKKLTETTNNFALSFEGSLKKPTWIPR